MLGHETVAPFYRQTALRVLPSTPLFPHFPRVDPGQGGALPIE